MPLASRKWNSPSLPPPTPLPPGDGEKLALQEDSQAQEKELRGPAGWASWARAKVTGRLQVRIPGFVAIKPSTKMA